MKVLMGVQHPESLCSAALGWLSCARNLGAWRCAGELTVDLGKSEGVTFVGAFRRWDADGEPRSPGRSEGQDRRARGDGQGRAPGRQSLGVPQPASGPLRPGDPGRKNASGWKASIIPR